MSEKVRCSLNFKLEDILTLLSIIAIISVWIDRAALSAIRLKLDNIERSTNEIKVEIAQIRQDQHMADNRITKLEESVKSAHKRIDDMQEHCDKMHLE